MIQRRGQAAMSLSRWEGWDLLYKWSAGLCKQHENPCNVPGKNAEHRSREVGKLFSGVGKASGSFFFFFPPCFLRNLWILLRPLLNDSFHIIRGFIFKSYLLTEKLLMRRNHRAQFILVTADNSERNSLPGVTGMSGGGKGELKLIFVGLHCYLCCFI